VVLARAGQKSVVTHLRYIERDGTTREGGRGQAYGPDDDTVDLKAFEERGRGDRHQFRLILSVEDASELQDLKRFTREFMCQVEKDVETHLDWVAVDHWDTDNPHTHIVLRGRAAEGGDLVIASDYMAHGMRMRASDIATEWLGPRTELEIQECLRKEVTQERLTSLDRALIACANGNVVDLAGEGGARRDALQLHGRLQRLEAMGLVEKTDGDRWRLALTMRETLVAMGERGDVVRAVNRALSGAAREISFEPPAENAVVGRVAGKGIADELSDRTYLVVDGIDGRAHYLRMPPSTDLSEYPLGSVVQSAVGKGGFARTRLLCHLRIEDQVNALGPTWLDRQLIAGTNLTGGGFGAIARQAIEQRANVLTTLGFAESRGGKFMIAPNLLASLRARELDAVARQISTESRKPQVSQGAHRGAGPVAMRELKLASGRIAVRESAMGFTLVPWSKDLRSQLGGEILARQFPSR